MRRLPILGVALATAAMALGALSALAGPASARAQAPTAPAQAADDAGRVSILKVEGLIDPVMASFIDRSITEGERARVVAVVIQLDSPGSVLDDPALIDLARHIHDATVPVAVWIGPSGSRALGGAAQLAGAAERIGIAPGARIGKTGELVVPDELLSPAFVAAEDRLKTGTITGAEAYKLKITAAKDAPVIGEFLIDLPGFKKRSSRASAPCASRSPPPCSRRCPCRSSCSTRLPALQPPTCCS